MRTFNKKINKLQPQCDQCGLTRQGCICDYEIELVSRVEFWLLTHEEELKRTSNTGRLIEKALTTTRVIPWQRKEVPQELVQLIESGDYNIFLVFSDEREEEQARTVSFKEDDRQTVFLILDGTWKEARKMLRKSPYLDQLPILALKDLKPTRYDLRRNKDLDHICTVEVAIELLKLSDEKENSKMLGDYFNTFLDAYHAGRYNHEVKK